MDLLSLNKLKEALFGYLKVKIELLKLDIAEHASILLSQVIVIVLFFSVAMMVLLFAGMALAHFLNELFGNSYGGYLVVAGLLLFVLLYLYVQCKSGRLKAFLEDSIVNGMSEDDEQ